MILVAMPRRLKPGLQTRGSWRGRRLDGFHFAGFALTPSGPAELELAPQHPGHRSTTLNFPIDGGVQWATIKTNPMNQVWT
jgi:hypothetical protein